MRAIRPLGDVRSGDALLVGGKAANLGELHALDLRVPDGFAITVEGWRIARARRGVHQQLRAIFRDVDVNDTAALRARCRRAVRLVEHLAMPAELADAIAAAWSRLDARRTSPMIVRSSAPLEDSAQASSAGMNETVPNVHGQRQLMRAVQRCWASMFTPRAVFYRSERGMDVADADIAVAVHAYVPATRSGICFTVDPSPHGSGNLVIDATIGGGTSIVGGRVVPDHYEVDRATFTVAARDVHDKAVMTVDDAEGGIHETEVARDDRLRGSLNDVQIEQIARVAMRIEEHFGAPQDVEWLIDDEQQVWIVQSRPITTVQQPAQPGTPLVRGIAASAGVAAGPVRVLQSPQEGEDLATGDVLVAAMTSPDWTPVLRRAGAIVTDSGGATCHAAIVARELGTPCIVGASNATSTLHAGDVVTVDGGRGEVHAGDVRATLTPEAPTTLRAQVVSAQSSAATTATQLMVNLSDPEAAAAAAALECDGVGLVRSELMLVEALRGVHPLELAARGQTQDASARLAAGIVKICEAFAPRPVTYRTVDLRSNEFARLEGGVRFEPREANPMLGARGAGRYAQQPELLELEATAIASARRHGCSNLRVMLPFVRTPDDVARCLAALADPALELWIMAEVPSVRWELAAYQRLGVAGISIGSNDLTQLLLGVDRDSPQLARYDTGQPAVLAYLRELLAAARSLGLATSICGQAPALDSAVTRTLVAAGIDSISIPADALRTVRREVDRAERRVLLDAARP